MSSPHCPPRDARAGSRRERRCSARGSPCWVAPPLGCKAFKPEHRSVGALGICADSREGQKKDRKGEQGGRKEGRRQWEEGKESRMIFKPERCDIKKKKEAKNRWEERKRLLASSKKFISPDAENIHPIKSKMLSIVSRSILS